MRRDIRSWSELEDMLSEIEEGDCLAIHIAGYEVTAVVDDLTAVRDSVESGR